VSEDKQEQAGETGEAVKTPQHHLKGWRQHQDPDGSLHAAAGHLGGKQTASIPGQMSKIGRIGGSSNSKERMSEIGRIGAANRWKKQREKEKLEG
jgi:hypothetical protein